MVVAALATRLPPSASTPSPNPPSRIAGSLQPRHAFNWTCLRPGNRDRDCFPFGQHWPEPDVVVVHSQIRRSNRSVATTKGHPRLGPTGPEAAAALEHCLRSRERPLVTYPRITAVSSAPLMPMDGHTERHRHLLQPSSQFLDLEPRIGLRAPTNSKSNRLGKGPCHGRRINTEE